MNCYRCGKEIDQYSWLDDGGPLCAECAHDVRAFNVAKNRERERRGPNLGENDAAVYEHVEGRIGWGR